uniref:G_PROTEIN_RECEP_F1_2 domain-containing protein n=1 Tax=Panagrellus redivivus TaxID=6233 RepID=A0A7E4UYD4_PANRE
MAFFKIVFVTWVLAIFTGTVDGSFSSHRWIAPLNNVDMIRLLCTEQMHKHVVLEVQQMRNEQTIADVKGTVASVVQAPITTLLRYKILCRKRYPQNSQKYVGLIWFMQSLDFCDVNRVIGNNPLLHYTRDFQLEMLRAGFSLVCQRTDDIGKYQLSAYADLFRIIYERNNVNRPIICNRLLEMHQDLYGHCHVDADEANMTIAQTRCEGHNAAPLIKLRSFFSRFSRHCQTLTEFFHRGDLYDTRLGEALANDTVFMNMLSSHVKRNIQSYSTLPQIVLKTRLLLQHMPLASIKVMDMVMAGRRCKNLELGHINLDASDNATITTHETEHNGSDDPCKYRIIDEINSTTADEFVRLGTNAYAGIIIEQFLLCCVIFNSVILSILLAQTKEKLSTATILFIFNIMFSNAFYVGSFICMFLDFLDGATIGDISEDQLTSSAPPVIIAETLQTHLFANNQFIKHLIQETLFSIAQNGSLLGLTSLLVLVFAVINKSMSGAAVKLSRRYVIALFSVVWVVLVTSHIVFSVMQFMVIWKLDHMFSMLSASPGSLNCSAPLTSDYTGISSQCDAVAIFHDNGVYLLRGHTLFTLVFMVISTIIFCLTLWYHWRVRSQHDFLGDNMRDQSPHRRRETLFNTLLLSICAFFVSVLGQSFIEIAVFFVDDNVGVGNLACYYQWARIICFVDPLLNPVLVAVRTPVLRRKLRHHLCGLLSVMMPWIDWRRRRNRRTGSSSVRKRSATTCGGFVNRKASSTTGTIESVTCRLDSVDESETGLKLFCNGRFRSSSTRQTRSVSAHNSII